MSLSQLASLSLSSDPLSASHRLNRSRQQLDLKAYPEAYFEAVQGLDDDVVGLTEDLRRELVIAAGRSTGGAAVWDLAVVHYQEASELPFPSDSSPSLSAPPTPAADLTSLLTTALQNLQRLSTHPRLLRLLGEKKVAFLEEAFPGLSEEEEDSDAEWEDESGDEEESEEDEEDEDEAPVDTTMTSS